MLIFKLDNNPIFNILFLPPKPNKKTLTKTIPSVEQESYPFFIKKKVYQSSTLAFPQTFLQLRRTQTELALHLNAQTMSSGFQWYLLFLLLILINSEISGAFLCSICAQVSGFLSFGAFSVVGFSPNSDSPDRSVLIDFLKAAHGNNVFLLASISENILILMFFLEVDPFVRRIGFVLVLTTFGKVFSAFNCTRTFAHQALLIQQIKGKPTVNRTCFISPSTLLPKPPLPKIQTRQTFNLGFKRNNIGGQQARLQRQEDRQSATLFLLFLSSNLASRLVARFEFERCSRLSDFRFCDFVSGVYLSDQIVEGLGHVFSGFGRDSKEFAVVLCFQFIYPVFILLEAFMEVGWSQQVALVPQQNFRDVVAAVIDQLLQPIFGIVERIFIGQVKNYHSCL